MKYFDEVNIIAASLLVFGIILVLQKDTPTQTNSNKRTMGIVFLVVFVLILAYKIYSAYREIGDYQSAIKSVDAAARYEAESRYPDRDSYPSVAAERRAFMQRTGRI